MAIKKSNGACELYMKYLEETIEIIKQLDQNKILEIHQILKNLKGRLFILGNGGSAANASHAVNDFRRIMKIEAYSPVDNVSELTAIINDMGWEYSFKVYLQESNLNSNDCILILSVSGGTHSTSTNILRALDYAAYKDAKVVAIIGKENIFLDAYTNNYIVIPQINEKTITPHTEELQSVILHMLVTI